MSSYTTAFSATVKICALALLATGLGLFSGCETTTQSQTSSRQSASATGAQSETRISDPVYPAEALDREPETLQRVRPESLSAFRTQASDKPVFVEFVVTPKGDVVNVTSNVEDPSLAYALFQTYRQWRYKPGTIDGKPVHFRLRLPVEIDG